MMLAIKVFKILDCITKRTRIQKIVFAKAFCLLLFTFYLVLLYYETHKATNREVKMMRR